MKTLNTVVRKSSSRCHLKQKMISIHLRVGVALAVFALVDQVFGQWTEQVLQSLVNYTPSGDTAASGSGPRGTLVQGDDGALYGVNERGGINNGWGTVFKLNCDGSGFTVLHTFRPTSQEGANPFGGLMQGMDGALYGMTETGGSSGAGVLFRLNKDGSGCTILHQFGSITADGRKPSHGCLIQGKDDTIYGTTGHGGSNDKGVVFKIDPDGTHYSILHDFASDDGYGLAFDAGVMLGTDGALYGTTSTAGTNGFGTIYKLNADGSGYTMLHTFGASGDGNSPNGPLVQGADGVLYGTTYSGRGNLGTVFKINPDGAGYLILYVFPTSGAGPQNPSAGLALGRDGYLYGTTWNGGAGNNGTVFAIRTDGTGFTLLHSFPSYTFDGANLDSGVMQGKDGALYGVTVFGGSTGSGTVFRLAPPSPPLFDSPKLFSDGSCRFWITGPAGQNCRVDVSTNLKDWRALTNFTSSGGAVQVIDSSASTDTQRFYRAATSP